MPSGSQGKYAVQLNNAWPAAVIRPGITLIELLVAISVISLLMAILLPAIQGARESGRRSVCQDHLRQVGLAVLAHESANGRFPTGGWAGGWVGEPDRGTGNKQPGGWLYCILPYLGERDLANTGRGLQGAARQAALAEMVEHPLAVLHCPTRRGAERYVVSLPWATKPVNTAPVALAGRSDYAANAGDQVRCDIGILGPPSLAAGDSPTYPWPNVSDHTGVIYMRSEITRGYLEDGSAHTYLVAEKSVSTLHYTDGGDNGDDWSLYTGYQNDICRSAGFPPRPDSDALSTTTFGSAHANAFNALFCDGSCRPISYYIEFNVHRMLANRADVLPLNEAKLSWD